MWKMKSDLNTKILCYFLVFSILILGFLWTFQGLFLSSYYKYVKTNEIKDVISSIKKNQNKNNLESYVEELSFENEELKLTPKEYEMLCYFVKNKGIALSRETLLSKIWGYDFFGDDRTVDTHIKMLRNNLGKYRDHIITIRGVGYKYVEDEE